MQFVRIIFHARDLKWVTTFSAAALIDYGYRLVPTAPRTSRAG
ncbi:hypothetical protein ACI79G_06680 [Geodermatophilus sp. SYSU D00779]